MTRRLVLAVAAAMLLVSMSVGAALAGEITGNGKVLHTDDSKWGTGLHGRSLCAFSGQEDLQFFEDEDQMVRKEAATRGDPGHAQSWGQIPQEGRAFLTSIGEHPGTACNPIKLGAGGEG